LAQTKKALESLTRKILADQGKIEESCLFFAGDFNEEETGAVCQLLGEGRLSASFRSPSYPESQLTKSDISHSFAMKNLYHGRYLPTFCALPCVTQPTFGFALVDFLFYSHTSLRPMALREPFTVEQARLTCSDTSRVSIPATWHFSDHVPIGGVFEFAADSNGPQEVPLI